MGNNSESTPNQLPTFGEDVTGTIFNPDVSTAETIFASYQRQNDVLNALNDIFDNGLYDELMVGMQESYSPVQFTPPLSELESLFKSLRYTGTSQTLNNTLQKIEDYVFEHTGLKVKMIGSPDLDREVLENLEDGEMAVTFDVDEEFGEINGVEWNVLTRLSSNQYLSSEDGLNNY